MQVTVTATITTEFEELTQQVLSNGRVQLVEKTGYQMPSAFGHPDYLRGVRAARKDFRTMAQAEAYTKEFPWWADDVTAYDKGYRAGVLTKYYDMKDRAKAAMAAY